MDTSRERAAEPEEFEQVFERYFGPVTYYFCHRGFSMEESQDLAQETFLKAYRGWAAYRRDSGVKTWLYKIARRTHLNQLRSLKAEKRDAPEGSLERWMERGRDIPWSGAGPDRVLLTRQQRGLLLGALGDLPLRMRQCFLLRYFHDLKYREIAQVMEISIQTVKSQISQANKRLRERLGHL